MSYRGRLLALAVLVAAVTACSGDTDETAVSTSAPHTAPEATTAAPWWEGTSCGVHGDLHGEEMAGRPVDDDVVFSSLEKAVAAQTAGIPRDYRAALTSHFTHAEPISTEEREWGEGRAEITFLTYPTGPGGATLRAVTWGEERWALSEFGHAVPCDG